jgi:hypothetical protein
MKIFNKNSLIYLVLVLGVSLIAAPQAISQTFSSNGNPGDTASGEVMTAYGTNETLNYQDANSNSKPVTYPASNLDFTVSPEYGLSMDQDITDLNPVTPGEVVNHNTYSITNEGNTDLPLLGSYYYEYGGGSSNWTVEVRSGAAPIFAPLVASIVSTESTVIVEDSHIANISARFYRVYVSPLVAEAPDGSYIDVYTTYETTATPVGTYEGATYLFYGGTSESDDYFRDQVAAPLMIISRTNVIDSPSGYTGGANDPVPGAVVTFTMVYTNEGSANAESVILIDKITTKEGASGNNLAHVDADATTHNGVPLTHGGQGTATGWAVSYSIISSPATTYGATANWTPIGDTDGTQYPGAGLYTTASSEYGAVWIKWEKGAVTSAESASLVWGVTIR